MALVDLSNQNLKLEAAMSSNSTQHQRECALKVVHELLTSVPTETAEAIRALIELINLDHSTAQQSDSED